MELSDIQANLQESDYQFRLKAIAALRDYPSATAIPLLQQHEADPEFLVRTFVARELSYHRTDESFATLLEMMLRDNTPNVRAEAANSLSLFGSVSAAHLVSTFLQDDHWLVRRSILAALVDMAAIAEIWEVVEVAIANREDAATRETAVRTIGLLANTVHEPAAIAKLTTLSTEADWRIRQQVAYALKGFTIQSAKDLLAKLKQDSDHRVVGAALEEALP
ncbi:HEAT repeat domain-containing protein [filamentous cyanobacterium LEGE 11480]|uniref:HEAT repeat domain-containing protein n=1 Tax=Romeriopsis navalis LEGE 11480 TaxID=2777977 RepID=A0A928Z360_9CYAN|nr:HEAT repeat domain-containing protein [Romeriopsis navalis]MBE9029732.1 HEAT repeat domain-containing protein [Romeriopsis navalis LEGE 11480]